MMPLNTFQAELKGTNGLHKLRNLCIAKIKGLNCSERISERKTHIHYNRIGIAHKEEADDLTIISGIGGWIKEKLNALDIYTFQTNQ